MKTLWAVACAAVATAGMLASPVLAEEPKPLSSAAVASAPAPSTTVPPAPASAVSLPVSQAGPQYRLGPEDILHVSVWENKELTLDVMVRPDGKISLPLIQDVQAEGLTAVELSSIIQQKLKVYIVEPQVSVIVTQVNSPKVYVLGSVAKPGPFPLRSDMSILQALSLAGGFTQFASPRSIKLIRGTGTKQEVRKVNYYNLLDEGGEGNYLLKPGDTIVVP